MLPSPFTYSSIEQDGEEEMTTSRAQLKRISHFILSQKVITHRITIIFSCWKCGRHLKLGDELVSLSGKGNKRGVKYYCMACATNRQLVPPEKQNASYVNQWAKTERKRIRRTI